MNNEQAILRQIDFEIARALGWHIYHYDKDVAANCYYALMDEGFDVIAPYAGFHTGERATEAGAWEDTPKFSTDLVAAFELVEWQRAQWAALDTTYWTFKDSGRHGWRVEIEAFLKRRKRPVILHSAVAPTLPLAVCRCFLMARAPQGEERP